MIIFSGSGTVSISPSDIPDAWEWWEPEREGLANNDPIPQLTGQVAPGSGHDWVQATGIIQPIFETNQINGLGAMLFGAGAQDWMNGVNPSALTAVHFFLVLKNINPTSNTVFSRFGTAATIDVYGLTADNKIYCGAFSTTRRDCGDPAASLTDWRVLEVVSTSSEYTVKLDGTQLFTSGTNTVASPSSCTLGADTAGSLAYNNGRMAGIYIFSAKLTTDRATMVTYLNSRFGLSIS